MVFLALSYSFDVTGILRTHLETLNRHLSTTLTAHRLHHTKAAIQRLSKPRTDGSRGLLDLVSLYNRQIITVEKYFIQQKQETILKRTMLPVIHRILYSALTMKRNIINNDNHK